MDRYERAFLKALKYFGESVTIETRTPQLDAQEDVVKDDDNQIVYESDTNTTTAQIDIIKPTDRIIEGLKLKHGDAMAYFQKKDVGYLNIDSYVTDSDGIYYKIAYVNTKPLMSVEVALKRVE